jgi:hypothetical protein
MNDEEDQTLIQNIQNRRNETDSLNELVNRHSGIYLEMVNAFSSPGNQFVDRNELIQEKEYRIYKAALNYDENRGAKFSTYLGNETKWLCLNTYNKNRRKPIFQSEFIENCQGVQESEGYSDISESLKKDLFDKVLSILNTHPDKRVEKIFKMRYVVGQENKVMPWKNVCSKMKLSIQGCINIHNSAVKYVQQELKEEISFE